MALAVGPFFEGRYNEMFVIARNDIDFEKIILYDDNKKGIFNGERDRVEW
ncbi:MAG: hypothetical protein Q4D52_03880 [Eubacteriales bacterium]|nr:hypothetical protein [Eubacteriales bacterium]